MKIYHCEGSREQALDTALDIIESHPAFGDGASDVSDFVKTALAPTADGAPSSLEVRFAEAAYALQLECPDLTLGCHIKTAHIGRMVIIRALC